MVDDGLEQMKAAVERRRVEASRHPRSFQRASSPPTQQAQEPGGGEEMPPEPPPSPISETEQIPVASQSTPKRSAASSPRRTPSPSSKAPRQPAASSPEPGVSALNTTYVRPSQLKWLRGMRAAALVEGVSVSTSDIVRVALDRLSSEGDWPDLKEELLREYRARASRKPEGRTEQAG